MCFWIVLLDIPGLTDDLLKLDKVLYGLADKGTGKKQDIKITGASTLGSDEVDRMVKDAEQYADEDKKQREAVDVKNQVSYSTVIDKQVFNTRVLFIRRILYKCLLGSIGCFLASVVAVHRHAHLLASNTCRSPLASRLAYLRKPGTQPLATPHCLHAML